MLEDRPRTLLALLVAQGNRTHEEQVADFNDCARKLGESATLSLRQFDRWLAGELRHLPRKTSQRVAEANWKKPISELLSPPSGNLSERVELPAALAPSSPKADELGSEEADMERRTVIRSAFTFAGAGLAASTLSAMERVRRSMDTILDTTNVGTSTVARWERTAYEYAASYQTVPPRELLADVVADFNEIRGLLELRHPIRMRRSLCQSAAQMAALAGIFLSAMGYQREARSWFHTAKLGADEAGDAKLAGTAIVRSATVSLYYGSPGTALQLAQTARHVLGTTPCASQVRASVVAARAMARTGSHKAEAVRLISEARSTFDRLPRSEVENTALGFTERQFLFTTGSAYTHLGMTHDAEEVQQRALSLYQSTEYLDPALIRLDQARSLVNRRDAVAGCDLAVSTIANAPEQHRSGLITHCARQLYSDLPQAARTLPSARKLRDLLTQSS